MQAASKPRLRVRIAVLVIAIIVGTGVGLALEKAHGIPMCDASTGGCPTARVNTGADGARHYNRGHLGHVARVRYAKEVKRAISIKVRRWHNRRVNARGGNLWDNTEAWSYYRRRTEPDGNTCVSSANLRVGPSTRGWAMTCEGRKAFSAWQEKRLNGDRFGPAEVDLIVCGGLAGIGWKAGVAAGLGTGGWAWLTIGAGAAACLFQDDLRRLAD